MSLVSNELLTHIEAENPKLGIYLRKFEKIVNQGFSNAGVSATGNIQPPAPPESVAVSPATTGDMMQVVVNHVAPIQKGTHYIFSIANNPEFHGAMTRIEPATRSPLHFALPTYAADGVTKHDYHVAVQVQYPGSDPSAPTYHGGDSPSPVQLNGSAAADILPGTGSGTALNGGQTLVGLGKVLLRPAPAPKRSV